MQFETTDEDGEHTRPIARAIAVLVFVVAVFVVLPVVAMLLA